MQIREHTYRAWVVDRRQMMDAGDLGQWFGMAAAMKLNPYNAAIMLEWTGMLDDKKVKIFEGDITKTPKGVFVVVYSLGMFVLKEEQGDDGTYDYHLWELDKEVIGNVYENPELLNEK